MSTRTIALVLLIFLLAPMVFINAQNSSDLITLGDRIVSHIQSKNPDWKYEAVEPIAGSADVIVQQWTLDNRSIRIVIVSHKSASDAASAISKLARDGQVNERLNGLGDEGISWGRGVVSFRAQNFTIDVSSTNTEPILDLNEAAKKTADERKLAREFAQLVADAVRGR